MCIFFFTKKNLNKTCVAPNTIIFKIGKITKFFLNADLHRNTHWHSRALLRCE